MNVMKKAWEIAREGHKKFGGKVKEYFAAALCMAWSIVKKGEVKMVELTGSEKQVKWANDIRAIYMEYVETAKAEVEKVNKRNLDFSGFFTMVEEQTSAKFWIETFKVLTSKNTIEAQCTRMYLVLSGLIEVARQEEKLNTRLQLTFHKALDNTKKFERDL